MKPEQTAGATGWQYPLLDYVKWVLQTFSIEGVAQSSEPTEFYLKIGFDGAVMTKRKKLSQEIGTFSILTQQTSLSEAKSPYRAYQFIVNRHSSRN